MPGVSGFFDPRAAMRAIKGVPPRMDYDGRDGSYCYVIGERDPHSGRYIPKRTPLPFGFKAIADWGTAERGWLSYNPYDDTHLVPKHQPVDPNPPGEGYTRVVRLMLYLEGYGMVQWTISGTIAQNAMFLAFLSYRNATEAAAGKIPVLLFGPSEQIAVRSRNGELHPAPRVTTAGWVERDADRWGTRTVPIPVAKVEDDNSGGAPLLPEAPPVGPEPVKPLPPANDVAPVPAAPAANDDDLFATMTPASKAPPF